MAADVQFKLTYGTMFNPPEELHTRYEEALRERRANLGQEVAMLINGEDVYAADKFENRNPANTDEVLAIFQKGGVKEARAAIEAAQKAFPVWSRMKWQDRVALIRRAADLLSERIYEAGVIMSLEVGKNRMEALGDVAETADLLRYSCDQMEANDGYIKEMGRDPLTGFNSTNWSVMKPYGVWVVISPFNFPMALTGGPAGAALVTGNTVIMKPATDTPWSARILAECFREAGIPDGVFNYVTGPGSTLGQTIIEAPEIAGITFTGSYDVGMKMYRDFAKGAYIRPIVLELGGKNPAIVTKHANLDDAATGIVRSAFGLQGQKCSACSRVYIEEPVYDELVERLIARTKELTIGDPTDRQNYMGPVINRVAYHDYQQFSEELQEAGRLLTGGKVLTDGPLAKGYFVAPTLVDNLPYDHRLWKHEMFLPITTIGKFTDMNEAMRMANDVIYGLTAGIYGSQEEVEWFFENIEAGVTYSNRPQGITTGAWPGFQPFGGWKGSGATGKNAGGLYYLPLYMREQIHNRVARS